MTDTLPTILIVDDEVRSLEALERNLSDDFDVKTAATIDDANAILDTEPVQIILCDQRMPEMTGVEFLSQARERWPEIIRIIISGYTDAEDIFRPGMFGQQVGPELGAVQVAHILVVRVEDDAVAQPNTVRGTRQEHAAGAGIALQCRHREMRLGADDRFGDIVDGVDVFPRRI